MDSDAMPVRSRRPKRVTILDVAALAGVSSAAVSKVLRNAYGVSPDMRFRVEAAVAELGYRPNFSARGMRGGRTFTTGMVADDIQNPFVGVMAAGASTTLAQHGYEMLVGQLGTHDTTQHTVRAMIDRQMDGLILIGPGIGADALESLAEEIPTVVVGTFEASSGFDTVTGDDPQGVEALIDHLGQLGHRRIAFLAHPEGDAPDPHLPTSVRLAAYVASMKKRGLDPHVIPARWSVEGGESAVREILRLRQRPTAIFTGADVTAFGVLSAFWEAGIRVPDDMSVVGFDDAPPSGLAPISLTTVSQTGFRIGELAADLVLGRIEGRSEPRHLTTESHLVVRRSTGPVPGRRVLETTAGEE